MGFLDSLKDAGFGNTGPYGRMKSGATNYANYAKERQATESERGVSQAIALAAKGGKMIDMKQAGSISEKWGMPYMEVAKRVNVVNKSLERETIKQDLQTLSQLYMSKSKEDPRWMDKPNAIMDLAHEAGVNNPKTLGIAKDMLVKLRDQKKTAVTSPGEKIHDLTTSLGGKTTTEPVIEHKAGPADEWEQMDPDKIGTKTIYKQRNKKTGEIKRKVVDESSGGSSSDKSKSELESDIMSLSQKILGGELGENMVEEAMKSETAIGALKKAQEQLKLMVTVYEERHGKGSARRLGRDTKAEGKRARAIAILQEQGKESTPKNIQFVLDRM